MWTNNLGVKLFCIVSLTFNFALSDETVTYDVNGVATVVTVKTPITARTTQATEQETPAQDGFKVRSDEATLFQLTHGFLDMVQPYRKGHFAEILPENKTDLWNNFGYNHIFSKHFSGFIICIIVGAVLAFLVTIWGCVYCCCRICCFCQPEPSDDPYEIYRSEKKCCPKWGIICSASFVIILSIMILLASIGVVGMSRHLNQQTRGENNLPKQLENTVESVERYINDTLDEVWRLRNDTVAKLSTEIDSIISDVGDLSERLIGQLESDTGINETFTSAEKLADKIKEIQLSGLALNKTLSDVMQKSEVLEKAVMAEKQKTLEAFDSVPNCNDVAACRDARQNVAELQLTASFSEVKNRYFKELDLELAAARDFLQWNASADIHEARKTYSDVLADIRNVTQSGTGTLKDSLQQANRTIYNESSRVLLDAEESVNSQEVFEESKQRISESDSYTRDVGFYFLIATVILFTIMCVIVICNLIGSCWGLCRELNTCYCNKGKVYSKSLGCAVALQFIFFAIFTIVVILLFTVGGLFHTQFCRHVVGLEKNPHFDVVNNILQKQLKDVKIEGNITTGINITVIISGCEYNKAIYEVLELDKHFNLDEILDEHQLRKEFNDTIPQLLDGTFIDLEHVEEYGKSAREMFKELPNRKHLIQNITRFRDTLRANDILTNDLMELSQSIKDYAESLDSTAPYREEIEILADNIRVLHTTVYEPVRSANKTLFDEMVQLESQLTNKPTMGDLAHTVQENINKSIDMIKSDADAVIKTAVLDFAEPRLDTAVEIMHNVKREIRQEVGRCQPVFTALNDAVTHVCVQTLDPFNAFWFCLGVAVFLFIPTLALDICLLRWFRRDDHVGRFSRSRFGSDRNDRGYAEVHYTLQEEQRKSLLELNTTAK